MAYDSQNNGKATIKGEVIIVAKQKGMDTDNRHDSLINDSDRTNEAVTTEQKQNNKKRKKNM